MKIHYFAWLIYLYIILLFQTHQMGCVVACAAGCFGCCCSQLSTACVQLIGRQRVTKLYYIMIDIFLVVPCIFIFYYIGQWEWFNKYFSKYIHCPDTNDLSCLGSASVYRLSFSLLLIYFVLFLFMLGRNRLSKVVNEGLFFIKYLIVVAIFIALLWVKNDFFVGYSEACKYIGIIFLILQSIILIDLFYLWGIKWVKRYDRGEQQFAILLIVCSVGMYVGAITLNVLGYIHFKNCSLWTNVITTILIGLLPVTQLLHFNKQNSLLTTSVICLYISYISYNSQFSKPQCNALNKSSMIADICVSTFLFFLTMYGSIRGGSGVIKTSANGNLNQNLGIVAQDSDEEDDQKEKAKNQITTRLQPEVVSQQQSLNNYQNLGWAKWHIYMMIGSMYISMLVTNWNSTNVETLSLNSYQANDFSFWSRCILEYVTALLYVWTLIAPRIFPDRDFQIE